MSRLGYLGAAMAFLVIGIVCSILSIVAIPTVDTELVEVPKSEIYVDETITVPAGGIYYYTGNFLDYVTLQITFVVISGGNEDVNFIVFDEAEYLKWRFEESAVYYEAPSRDYATSANIEWTPPVNRNLYFVFDNSFNVVAEKSVDVYFTMEWTEFENQQVTGSKIILPSEAVGPGLILIIAGVVMLLYPFLVKPKQSTSPRKPRAHVRSRCVDERT